METVILVDEFDNAIGEMEKMEAHEKGLLHRAFSIFLFNSSKQVLLQQRALKKYHSPGLWTNACCSHPRPNEDLKEAALRRLGEELNVVAPIEEVFSFTYHASFENGLIEHEYDHVFFGNYNGEIAYNTEEVMATEWYTIEEVEAMIEEAPLKLTPWFLIAWPLVKAQKFEDLK
jgi:isopentenyl-diphosphate Delta-isomerase